MYYHHRIDYTIHQSPVAMYLPIIYIVLVCYESYAVGRGNSKLFSKNTQSFYMHAHPRIVRYDRFRNEVKHSSRVQWWPHGFKSVRADLRRDVLARV